jgi:riboflavin synthase
VVDATPQDISFQAVPETIKRTVLGVLKKGEVVNLETPLTLSEPLGGHFVQGHVDGVGQILEWSPVGQGARLKVRVPDALVPYVIEKGSIALDGISLTVAAVKGDEVEVALIPHTLENTNLKIKKADDYLHVEADLLAKYVEKLSAGYLARQNP